MKLFIPFLISLLATIIPAANAASQSNFEITPQIGYRFGGDFEQENSADDSTSKVDLKDKANFGLTLAWDYDRKRQGELIISHYKTEFEDYEGVLALENNDLSITYLHIGGNLPVSSGALPFWFSGGLGITFFSPSDDSLSDETEFSANLGLNTRIEITDNTALKIGGRMYATFLDSESEIFCDKENCMIYVSSDVWIQSEIYTGLTIKF